VIYLITTNGQGQEPLIQESKPQEPSKRNQEARQTKIRLSQGCQPEIP